jgi:hypothetical protein
MTLPSPTVAVPTGTPRGTASSVPCPYCLGGFVPQRSDAVYCSGDCRKHVHRARKPATLDDVVLASLREGEDPYSVERQRASGRGRLTHRECYAADLRVRCLAGEPVETRAQWEAVAALPGGPERLGFDAAGWADLGAALERQRREVAAWLAGSP